MQFAGLNIIAIVAAAVAGWLVGGAWYTALAKPWARALGTSAEMLRRGGTHGPAWVPFALSLLADLMIAWVLAGVLGHLGPGQVTLRNGVISAGFIWFGFVLTTITVNNAFGQRRPMLTLIDAAHWLLALVVMGAVIGAFGT